jgi:hypothetical protein
MLPYGFGFQSSSIAIDPDTTPQRTFRITQLVALQERDPRIA